MIRKTLLGILVLAGLLFGGCPTADTMVDTGDGVVDGGSDNSGDSGAPPVSVRDDTGDGAGGDNGAGSGGGDTDGTDGSDTGGTDAGDNGGTDGDGTGGTDGDGDGGTDGDDPDPTDPTDPTDPDDPGDPGENSQLIGTFGGTVTWQVQQGVGSTVADFPPQLVDLEVAFDADNRLVSVFVPGYSTGTPDQVVDVLAAGEKTGLAEARITFQSVVYTETTVEIALRVRQNRAITGLTEDGFGNQTISIALAGDTVTYASTMLYEVELVGAGPAIATTESYTTNATLDRR